MKTDLQEIVRITDAGPLYEGRLSPSKQAEITALVVCSAGTTSKILSYEHVRSSPGGPEALAEFLSSCSARSRPRPEDIGSTGRLLSYKPTRSLSPEPSRPPDTTSPLPLALHSKQSR